MGSLQDEMRQKVLQPQAAINNAVQQDKKSPPLNKQVWLLIKDNPGIKLKELAARMTHSTRTSISAALSDLVDRGMILKSKPFGGFWNYRVEPRMQQFELWPRPAKVKKRASNETAVQQVDTAPAAQPLQEAAPAQSVQAARFNVEELTVAQARQIYHQLHAMFGDMK